MVDGALLLWFILTARSVLYVGMDAFTTIPELPVMKWGWTLVTLYPGPVGLFVYLISCKEPLPRTLARYFAPL